MTSTANLTKTRKRSPERNTFLADVLVAAIEGGIDYWAEVTGYAWWFEDLGGSGPRGDALGEAHGGGGNAVANLREREDHVEYRLTLDTVARGIARIRDGSVTINSDIRRDVIEADQDNDAGMVDADMADCIVQAGILANITYG